ncbi:hypothetical protein [Marinimicrococcus flavescens]|uniref:Lipoprotein n=1 Tax=Marinimicrococcus flavescens TaxID=3031815 RepID=A0AAP3UZK6_9PROT|nr:hypothetical protein [Marinimicrococcus flavescens]
MPRRPVATCLPVLLLLAGCASTARDTAALDRYPGIKEQIISYYGNNASEQNQSCTGVEMTDITRATTLADTPQELILAIQYYWDVPDEQSQRGSVPCEGFATRNVTFTKSGGGLTLQTMSGTRP